MFLDECLYKLAKMLHYERINSSKGIEINKSKNAWFVIIGILKKIVINLNHMLAYDDLWIKKHCNSECNVTGVDFGCVLWIMTKMMELNLK